MPTYYGAFKVNMLMAENKIDQRYLFRNESKTVYNDNCCHFNKIGMEVIINDIIEKSENVLLQLLYK